MFFFAFPNFYCNFAHGYQLFSGLTGFDSGMKWYVSTRSVGGWLLNLSYQQFNWRKQLRSRCLTEV